MSIHDTPAYCGRCGGKHTGRKGQHCKHREPAQPATILGDSVAEVFGGEGVNEFSRNEFSQGRRDHASGWK